MFVLTFSRAECNVETYNPRWYGFVLLYERHSNLQGSLYQILVSEQQNYQGRLLLYHWVLLSTSLALQYPKTNNRLIKLIFPFFFPPEQKEWKLCSWNSCFKIVHSEECCGYLSQGKQLQIWLDLATWFSKKHKMVL